VIDHKPDATVYSNRSLCKLLMGDGEGALSDAYQCRMMRPDWAKACYRQAAAHMLLKVRSDMSEQPFCLLISHLGLLCLMPVVAMARSSHLGL
jgi:hypothetical protein